MLSDQQINTLKALPISDFLASRGIFPLEQARGRFLYRSPLREDQTANSFWVHQAQNSFKDFAIQEHRGDIIRLVQLLDACDFKAASQTLQHWASQAHKPSFSLIGQTSEYTSADQGKEQVKAVKLLNSKALIRYVESRSISYPIARTYLREVYYTHNQKNLYSLGFANDQGGYALRHEWRDKVGTLHSVKRNIGPSGYTTIAGTHTDSANLFEGVYDFLSALAYYGQAVPTYTTYVLNSVTNLAQLLDHLRVYRRINVFFDQDTAGRNAYNTLTSHNLPTYNQSQLYQGLFQGQKGLKDFNDFWIASCRG